MPKSCRERPPRRSKEGISLIALIITIIVIIILAAIILGVATSTPEKAKLATFISDISEVQQGVETKKATNYMPSADGTFDVNKGFTKVRLKKTPYSTDEDGWVVNLDNINIKSSTRGNDYSDVVENSQITFGEGSPDVYVYDSDGIVYYAPGFTDKENTIYSKADVTYAATGEIPRVEAENPSYWTFNTSTKMITAYTGPAVQELVVPNYINGVKVDGITGNYANFEGIIGENTQISSIIISPGLTTIGDCTFVYCNYVENVEIPSSITTIGDSAFYWCSVLNNVYIPSNVTTISDYAFCGCEGLETIEVSNDNTAFRSIDGVLFTKNGDRLITYPGGSSRVSYVIPSFVTTIGSKSFENTLNLVNITIPTSVTTLEDAFWECNKIQTISIPSSVTNIWLGSFSGCDVLTSINVDPANTAYVSLSGVLFSKDETVLHSCPKGNIRTTYTIPNGVTRIENGAFYYCTKLTTVSIPNTVTYMGRCFLYCYGLTSITIPTSLTSISAGTFVYCINLPSITIPSNITSIGNLAFYGCSKLTQITINKPAGSITGAKWSAPASTVVTWNP